MSKTFSSLGTVTWIDPEYYISYNKDTGEITGIGEPNNIDPCFQVTYNDIEKFFNKTAFREDYKVVNENGLLTIKKSPARKLVFKSHLVPVSANEEPRATIVRNRNKKIWSIKKISNDPLFVFVCKKGSRTNYIRTLEISCDVEVPFVYETENHDVSLYSTENNSNIEFIDE